MRGMSEQPRGPGPARVTRASRPQALRDGIARDPGASSRSRRSSRPRSRRPPRAAAADPRLPDLDRTDLPLVTIDPAGADGPRPGAAPRARRRRLRGALRDRRRRGVHHARRPGRRRGAPARPDAVRRGLPGPAAPDVDLRGRRLAAARPGPPRPALDDPASTRPARAPTSRSSGRGCAAGPSSTTRACSGRSTTARPTSRCMLLKEVGELRLAARGRPRRRLAAAARAGGRRRGRRVVAGVPRRCCPSRSGTRRSRCSPASPRRRSWSTRGSASCAPCRRRTRATSSGCTAPRARWASTGRPSSSTPTSSAASTPRKPHHAAMIVGLHPAAARQRVRRLRRRGARASRSTPRSPPSTPTSPRRCAGSATGTPGRSASRCAPAPTCRTGCSPRLARAARDDAGVRAAGASATSAMVLDLVEAGLLQHRVGETFDGGRGRGRREGPDPRRRHHPDPAVEARCPGDRPLPLGTDVRVRLTTADVDHPVGGLRARLSRVGADGPPEPAESAQMGRRTRRVGADGGRPTRRVGADGPPDHAESAQMGLSPAVGANGPACRPGSVPATGR